MGFSLFSKRLFKLPLVLLMSVQYCTFGTQFIQSVLPLLMFKFLEMQFNL